MERCVVCITTWQRRQAESQIPPWFLIGCRAGSVLHYKCWGALDPQWACCWQMMFRWEASVSCGPVSLPESPAGIADLFHSAISPWTWPGLHSTASAAVQTASPRPAPCGRPFAVSQLLACSSSPTLCTRGNLADITPPGSQGDWESEMPGCLPDQASMSLSLHWSHWGHPQITEWSSLPGSLLWESSTRFLSSSAPQSIF